MFSRVEEMEIKFWSLLRN